jgi:hypothetical protein
LKEGDEVVLSPFDQVRDMMDQDRFAFARRRPGDLDFHPRGYSHRARSDLGREAPLGFTILGNIVAVTSIIAVVALVRGMNTR